MFVKQICCALAGAGVFAGFAVVPAYAQSVTLSVSGCTVTSAPTGGNTINLSCSTSAPPVAGAPSGCSLTASPSTITGSTNVTLTAACTANATDSGTRWAWTTNGAALPQATTTGASPQSQIVQSVGATTTFGVTATNSTGPGPTNTGGGPGVNGGGLVENEMR